MGRLAMLNLCKMASFAEISDSKSRKYINAKIVIITKKAS